MNDIFTQSKYIIKRQGLAIGGKHKVFGMNSQEPILFVEEKTTWLPPTITLHIYQDEKKQLELLTLKDRPDDPSEDMDVFDAQSGQKIGSLISTADTFSEIFKDAWSILDADEKPIGKVFDKSLLNSAVRKALSHGIPQNLEINIGETSVGEYHQKSKAFGYELELDFTKDVSSILDRRIGIAIGLYIAYKQAHETN